MLNITGALTAPIYVYGAFAALFLLNVILGVILNCLLRSQPFEGKRIIQSGLKILTGAVVMTGVVLAFELFARGLVLADITLDQSAENIITSGMFILLFIKGFKNAAIDVYTKTRDLFEFKDNTTFDMQIIENMKIERDDPPNADRVDHEIKDNEPGATFIAGGVG